MTAKDIMDRYIAFFEKQGHIRIHNAPLVPENDPTTLFTSSGMQPLVPYLLGEVHPQGTRLVDSQDCFRAVDIDEIGDNRHTTFFRMLGNWSLGDYFKKEELPWLFTFLTDKEKGLGLDPANLYVTIFAGNEQFSKDTESIELWQKLFQNVGIKAKEDERILPYGVDKNWWSRSGTPEMMPQGEPGGPTSEVFYDFGENLKLHEQSKFKEQKCHVNCDCGRYIEIGNSVFMQYVKEANGGFAKLPKQNVDFGGGLERLLAASQHKSDVFMTSLFSPIVEAIEQTTKSKYKDNKTSMRIITDHFIAATFISASGIKPSNKDQGYILRRLIRRAYDNFSLLGGTDISLIIERIIIQYRDTSPELKDKFEAIILTLKEEEETYKHAIHGAQKFIEKRYKGNRVGDELMGETEISAEDAFQLYTTHGLSPTQIKSLGYTFNDQAFAEKMEEHQKLSRQGAEKKFKGGLADHSEKTVMGHTATHLLHQALRDVLGDKVHQTGSNITAERVRFDFNYDKRLTDAEIQKVEQIVNEKITANLPVHFELIDTKKAHALGAIGLFMDTYGEQSKIYFIGGDNPYTDKSRPYSIEFCGGPHVDFTGKLKSVKILKQENLGQNQKRLYAVVSG